MPFSDSILNVIYEKTAGRCYHCGKKLAWKNYGVPGERGSWEVDHSNPKVLGGTNYLRNLFPACVSCNRSKEAQTSREFISGRFLAKDFQGQRVVRKRPENLKVSDFEKMTPADRAYY